MKANRTARGRSRHRDGGQLLLLSGFLLAAAVLMAMGSYSVLNRTETRLTSRQSGEMLDLFLNTRSRTVQFFGLVSPYDTASSIEYQLTGYLRGQHSTARTLALDLNASLAGSSSDAVTAKQEIARLDNSGNYDLTADNNNAEDYSCLSYDNTNDGLISGTDGTVYAALVWIRVMDDRGRVQEVVVVDVPSTSPC